MTGQTALAVRVPVALQPLHTVPGASVGMMGNEAFRPACCDCYSLLCRLLPARRETQLEPVYCSEVHVQAVLYWLLKAG